MNYKQEKMVIPLLDLDKFIFSPPGPMGWALSEYEQTMNKPQDIVLNELSVVENLAAVKQEELVELPTIRFLDSKEEEHNQEIATSEELVEAVNEEVNTEINEEVTDEIIELEENEELVSLEPEKPKLKIKIIAPDQPVAPRLIDGSNAEVNEKVSNEVNGEVTDEIIELEENEELVSLEPEKSKLKIKIIAPDQPVAPKLMAGVEISKKKKK
ncbi:hypothetical protein H9I32_06965 [Bacillus sp. Xin]|uniref:hypothetical protein n=1 Tax=unclassified Bacillus (in: firmicutes) TaxID=185979 RepID=UPI0015738ED4|nr:MULTISPECIES: hypothetical protein [unclassified Bacillus (in: firmicutes)]MBC6972166.1 hypothetical protein [Bacillus sp. Xin]NSW36902.1 hypothetical protein [Bacillus sp. Xin1]